MKIGRITLAFAVAAVVGAMSGDLQAQEYTPPPAPSSATEKGGKAFNAENGPCFYNPYRWRARGLLNQSALASEMKDLAGGWEGAGSSGCVDHYGLNPADFVGSWSYMLIDGVRRPEGASQAQVKAVWEASRKAAEEAEAGGTMRPEQPTPPDLTPPEELETRTRARGEHAPVPPIGNGYGSSALVSRSVEFRVAPGPKPSTYQGIPIVERNRAWERVQTPDGRRVWRQTELRQGRYGYDTGLSARDAVRSRSALTAIDRGIQRQEGLRSGPRSSVSAPSFSSPSSSASRPSSSSSGTRLKSPRAGKKVEQ